MLCYNYLINKDFYGWYDSPSAAKNSSTTVDNSRETRMFKRIAGFFTSACVLFPLQGHAFRFFPMFGYHSISGGTISLTTRVCFVRHTLYADASAQHPREPRAILKIIVAAIYQE